MRAIDADALQLAIVEEGQANKRKKYIIGDIWELTGAEIREVINSQPTIQPEIVRCKDCKHWMDIDNGRQKHEMCAQLVPEWYCADGERKETEDAKIY